MKGRVAVGYSVFLNAATNFSVSTIPILPIAAENLAQHLSAISKKIGTN
jgi:hypothetical protein